MIFRLLTVTTFGTISIKPFNNRSIFGEISAQDFLGRGWRKNLKQNFFIMGVLVKSLILNNSADLS